ncbi:MAG: MarR family winged helix-turn-helix transcriptional regulator [Pseudomonadota bacterium]
MKKERSTSSRDPSEDWDLERFLSYRIARLNAVLNSQATRILEAGPGLSLGQWRVIVTIGAGGAATSRQLVEKTRIDPALISRLLKQLEKLGLVDTGRSEEDRRVLDVRLTPDGDAVYRKTFPIMEDRQRMLRACFNQGEAAKLDDFIARLMTAASGDIAR